MDRVLVWGLSNNRAGTEAVICNYVSKSPNVIFDFLCYEKPANHSVLFENTDNSFHLLPVKIKHPIKNYRALRAFMKENAREYDALWFNVNEISNIDLLVLAKKYGIQRRITHIHNSDFPKVFITKLFSQINWRKCLKLTTDRWSCSRAAGDFLFRGMPYKIIPNLIDKTTVSFCAEKRNNIRKQWKVQDSYVIGTVGRLANQKNQEYLISLLPEVLVKKPNSVLMIVGEGELRDSLISLAHKLEVENRVIFTGSQSDIQAYLSAFDVFAFPSFYEGLSLSALEAQFNGLPCIFSKNIAADTAISNNTIFLDLHDRNSWLKELTNAQRMPNYLTDKAKDFDLHNAKSIMELLND